MAGAQRTGDLALDRVAHDGVFQERDEEPIGLLLQPYASPVLQELPRGGVYFKRAELIDNSGICLHVLAPKAIED